MATKNLGQASAIISKSTPPTNTKVIWRDTSTSPAEHKVWNGTAWFKIKIDFFTDLEDTPNSYTNQAGKVLVVNQTEDGLEFAIQSGGIEEAPNDGQQYVRQSEGWAVVSIPEGYDTSDFNIDFATKTTDDLDEGATNLYYTEARVLQNISNNATAIRTNIDVYSKTETDGLVEIKVDSSYTSLGATPTIDLDTKDVYKRTMDANVTELTFTNGVEGKTYKLQIKVDATGGYTFAYTDTNIRTQDDIPLIMPSTALEEHDYYVELRDGKYKVTPIYNVL